MEEEEEKFNLLTEEEREEEQRSLRNRSSMSRFSLNRFNGPYKKILLVLVVITALFSIISLATISNSLRRVPVSPDSSKPQSSALDPENNEWKKPKGFKIVAMVFYGRSRFVNILDCYLRKNLVKNGGYLDEVRFVVHTENEDDIKWLDGLLQSEPGYSHIVVGGNYGEIWNEHATDPNTMYIKIDDDIMFIHDDAIPRMVHTLMVNPQAYNVAANIVNSPLTNWLHYHTNAVLPYLPDNQSTTETTSWRASQLPKHPGGNGTWEFVKKPEEGFQIGGPGGPPSQGHRWLPLRNTAENLRMTPIAAGSSYDAFGRGWTEWTIAAQQHYSFLDNLETDSLDNYWAGNKAGVWNMQFSRYNLNFLAIWGSSVALEPVGPDDEQDMTVTIPVKLNRPCLVDTHAVVAHYSFFTVAKEIEATDLLERYRLYANEKVCTRNNQRERIT